MFRHFAVFISILALIASVRTGQAQEAPPTLPYLPSPTYIPTSTPLPTFAPDVPRSDVYNFLATAAAQSNSLPDDPAAPGGVPLLPNDDGRQLFAYARWALSGTSVSELMGNTLSPIGVSLFVWVMMILLLTAIYLTWNVVITIIKFIAWIIQYVRALLPI